jgi:hypothetical protein
MPQGRRINTRFPRLSSASVFIVTGSVTLVNGAIPRRIVQLERVCEGRTADVAYADSRGQYSFSLGYLYDPRNPTGSHKSADSFADCTICASLEGYRTKSVELVPAIKSEKRRLAEIVLQPVGKAEGAIVSATDAVISEEAKNDYDRGLDLAANMMLRDAIAADTRLGEPYVDLAAIETRLAQWDKVIENTDKVISLDPDAFPRAYYLNTMANIKLDKADAALKSATEGIRVDQDHRFPDSQYMQGILLISKGDKAGVRTQLESYLALAPKGDNTENATRQLKGLPAPK